MAEYVTIENPMVGKTYVHEDQWGVYRYDTYPRGSVLEGQERRSLLDVFDSEAEARKAFPQARASGGSEYREIPIPHSPPEWFDPADAGETWDEEDAF